MVQLLEDSETSVEILSPSLPLTVYVKLNILFSFSPRYPKVNDKTVQIGTVQWASTFSVSVHSSQRGKRLYPSERETWRYKVYFSDNLQIYIKTCIVILRFWNLFCFLKKFALFSFRTAPWSVCVSSTIKIAGKRQSVRGNERTTGNSYMNREGFILFAPRKMGKGYFREKNGTGLKHGFDEVQLIFSPCVPCELRFRPITFSVLFYF